MTIAFISDLHLSAERPASISLFKDFIEKSVVLMDELYILGDFFDYWVGDDCTAALGFELVENLLKQTVDKGTPITFIAGNRDFLVGDEFSQRTGVKLISDETVIELNDQRVLLAHGDVYCTDDLEHMAARNTLLSQTWQREFLEKPLEQRLAFAQSLRMQSEEAKKNKSMDIMDVNQQAIVNAMEKHSADLLIHGHTHRPYVHRLTVNNQERRRYVLGDWYQDRSVLYAAEGKLYLKK